MKSDFLNFLECQSCKTGFSVKEVFTKEGNELMNATISCQCSEYPILGGIPIIKNPSSEDQLASTKYIIQRLKTGDLQETMSLAIDGQRSDKSLLWLFLFLKELGPFKKSLNPMIPMIRKLKKKHFERYSKDKISFFDLVDLLGWGTWGDYLKHRFSGSSFWNLYPFMPMIKEKNEMVFDFLCGAGHGSFVISTNANPKNHVCADLDYTLLFIVRKFFAPQAQFICLDANDPLPLKDGIFSSTIMMDSTHYVSNRGYLGKECQRTLKDDGVLLWLHLHNALSKNPSEGYSLSPSKWARLLGDLNTTILPEERVIEQFMTERKLDLKANYTESHINSSGAINILGTKDQNVVRIYENINCPSLSSAITTIINPIYNIGFQKGEMNLDRMDVTKIYKDEYPLTFKYIPARHKISGNLAPLFQGRNLKLQGDLPDSEKKELDEMLRKFIILQVPEKYI